MILYHFSILIGRRFGYRFLHRFGRFSKSQNWLLGQRLGTRRLQKPTHASYRTARIGGEGATWRWKWSKHHSHRFWYNLCSILVSFLVDFGGSCRTMMEETTKRRHPSVKLSYGPAECALALRIKNIMNNWTNNQTTNIINNLINRQINHVMNNRVDTQINDPIIHLALSNAI